MTEANRQISGPPPPPSLVAGIGVAGVVVAAIIAWVALGSTFLSEASLFGGFLMLWYWAKVEHLAIKRLPASICGGLVGIAVSWVMFYGVTNYGAPGFSVGLAVLIVTIYLDVVAIFPTWVNSSTMLYSLIAAAPLIQLKVDWIEFALATLGGGLFFGAFVAIVMRLAAKFAPQGAQSS